MNEKELPVDRSFCCGCTACVAICPHHALSMKEDDEGFLSPLLEVEKCIDCGLCKKLCPVLNPVKNKAPETVWAAWGKNEVERRASSSGALSSILARHILEKDRAVLCKVDFQ